MKVVNLTGFTVLHNVAYYIVISSDKLFLTACICEYTHIIIYIVILT